jgi:hypothetical protein
LKKTFNTTVSVKEGASRNVLRGIIQYDTLNEVNIRLSDGSKAFDYTGYDNIVFKVLKADGTSYIDSEGERVIATSPADGVITIILAGQSTTAAGLCQSVIEVYSAGEKMTTARFNYEVFDALEVDEDVVASEPEYSVLQNLMSDISTLEAAIEAAETLRVVAEEERAAAENARKEAEIRRENLETGYVAQAREARDEAREARDDANYSARIANDRAQETSTDAYLTEQYRIEARESASNASQSAREAAASAVEAKAGETVVLEAKESAQQSAAVAKASEAKATTAAAQAAEDAATVMGNIASAVESAESAEYNEMLAERWASTAKGWAEGGEVVTNVRLDDEGRTVFTIADSYGAKQYAADAKASAESIVQYETDLGAAVQSAQESATEAKSAEDAAVAAKIAAEKARDEAQGVAGGDFAPTAYVDNKMEEAVTQAGTYTDNELWDHNYSTSAHGDIRGRIYNVEKTRPLIVTVAKNDSGVYEADQYMEDIARAGNNGRVVIAVVATDGVEGDDGKPIDYDLYYLTDCHIVNRGVAAFTVTEIRFRNANGGEIVITSDDAAIINEGSFASADLANVANDTFAQKVRDSGAGGTPVVDAVSEDGIAYTATIPGIAEIEEGQKLIIIPNMTCSGSDVTLNVNGLGAANLMFKSTDSTAAMLRPTAEKWMAATRAVELIRCGSYWVTDITPTIAGDLIGYVRVKNGGTGWQSLPKGKYLVGNGTDDVAFKTPAEVLADIGAVSRAEWEANLLANATVE